MLVKVRVVAEADENLLTKVGEDLYEAKVTASKIEGEANKALTKLLENEFPQRRIRIVSGARKPHKIIEIT